MKDDFEIKPKPSESSSSLGSLPGGLSSKEPKAQHWLEQQTTFSEAVRDRYGINAEGRITEFLTRDENGRLIFSDLVDLEEMARRFGGEDPIDIVCLPQIKNQIDAMKQAAERAQATTGYPHPLRYAYATKANYQIDAVLTAISAGAHLETSAALDVELLTQLALSNQLPKDRYVYAHGYKKANFADALRALRGQGIDNVVPVLDKENELELYNDGSRWNLGIREREAGTRDGHGAYARFGVSKERIPFLAKKIERAGHHLTTYHAMVGMQVDSEARFLELLEPSLIQWAELRQNHDELNVFNIGGGMPSSGFSLAHDFDIENLLTALMFKAKEVAQRYGVPPPQLAGEFGRYTVANHSVRIFPVESIIKGEGEEGDWYMLAGSLLNSAVTLLKGNEFLLLPLSGWDRPMTEARLAGTGTCDGNDVFPHASKPSMLLPQIESGERMYIGMFGRGAYMDLLGGTRGAHHCLVPEHTRVTVHGTDDKEDLIVSVRSSQTKMEIAESLGYFDEVEPAPLKQLLNGPKRPPSS